MKITIKDLILKEGFASSLPSVYYDLKTAVEDEDSEFEDFEYIIKQNISLSARILKIVNIPFFGMPSQIETISHAVSIIWLSEINKLALSKKEKNNSKVPKWELRITWIKCYKIPIIPFCDQTKPKLS